MVRKMNPTDKVRPIDAKIESNYIRAGKIKTPQQKK